MFVFARVTTTIAADAPTWTCTFLHDNNTIAGKLEVRFDDDLNLTGASLDRPNGTSPSELSRFPWSHWIGVARNSMKARTDDTSASMFAVLTGVMSQLDEVGGMTRRPGRGGRGDAFYKAVLADYEALKRDGNTRPIVTLQRMFEERGERYSQHTVAGWVKKAKRARDERATATRSEDQ